jgi:sugar (pentulose or hexulose) kinase
LSLLADALGRDIWVSPESEASLRGAAVNVLEKLGYQDRPWPKGKLVRHNRRFAEKHRARRARQAELESILLEKGAVIATPGA